MPPGFLGHHVTRRPESPKDGEITGVCMPLTNAFFPSPSGGYNCREKTDRNAVALLCRQEGARVPYFHFVFERGGNIIDLSEHVDSDERQFFLRIAWDMAGFSIAPDDLSDAFAPLAKEF